MVLGKKKKKGISFQVDYIVSIMEIKPWPPSVALCSVQTVMIQWENGEQNSGFLPPGVPSLNGFDDGKIEFNEFFKLPVTLLTGKNQGFQKNYLEFHLYEPKKDKAIKGQLLGTATINLAEFGIIKDVQYISTPIIIKKAAKSMNQPMIYVQIQPFDNEGIESVLRMMNEQCDEDSEQTSWTDDEGTSTSSRTPTALQGAGNSPFQMGEMLNFVNAGLNSEQYQSGEEELVPGKKSSERYVFSKFSEVATTKKQTSRTTSTLKFGRKGLDLHGIGDKLKHIKSARMSVDSAGPMTSMQFMNREREESSIKEVRVDAKSQEKSAKKEKNEKPDNRPELESRIQMLEDELREAAAMEIGLYTVAAEHMNSKRKVHAPARRLSRFYRHVCMTGSQTKRASSARTIISGLVLVSKACGNDVSRLTFWLSNGIILRSMVTQITNEMPPSAEPITTEATKSERKKSEKKSPLIDAIDNLDDWENALTLIMALEKIEAWIFSRIVESLWWQSFAPHMLPAKKKKKGKRMSTRKSQKWMFGLGDQEQGTFSIELWKKAFQDACEKLCPIRAAGHDCGCLPMLSKMAMEQLVDRLDVAMFNAILRDSDEEMPTDPLSDPISELKVLPIPAGKSSFGAGAQLKNAVGSWSKWLHDFFDPDDNGILKDQDESNGEAAFEAFHLINALGDLMMLPLGMLLDATTRNEVCPILGGSLIKRIFSNFVPDEFSPDPITQEVLEALDSEDSRKASKDCIVSFPCSVGPIVYSPLPAALFSSLLGETSRQAQQKSGSSLLRKSHNSDDELDKLNLPLASISVQNICISPASLKPDWMPRGKGERDVVRYRLLQEAWRNGI